VHSVRELRAQRHAMSQQGHTKLAAMRPVKTALLQQYTTEKFFFQTRPVVTQ